MKKFILLYCGRDESAGSQARWGAWFGENAASLIDGGGPLGPGRFVTAGGSADVEGEPFIGYSIVSAETLADAEALAASSPAISGVRVYEALGM